MSLLCTLVLVNLNLLLCVSVFSALVFNLTWVDSFKLVKSLHLLLSFVLAGVLIVFSPGFQISQLIFLRIRKHMNSPKKCWKEIPTWKHQSFSVQFHLKLISRIKGPWMTKDPSCNFARGLVQFRCLPSKVLWNLSLLHKRSPFRLLTLQLWLWVLCPFFPEGHWKRKSSSKFCFLELTSTLGQCSFCGYLPLWVLVFVLVLPCTLPSCQCI